MAQESRLVIVIDAKNAERNARNLGNELDSIERKGDFATKSMDGLSVATRQLAGYMAGLVTVSAAISKMDTYTGLQNRLKLVTNNQVELNKATEDTFRIAQKTYSAWDSVLQVYQRFSDNAKTLNLTMDDTARLTETVSKAVAISGASAQAADAALVQFGQALASGTLRGEELNSVMEQTPALAKAIAQGMGITVGELRSVAAEGKITSQEIVKALRNVEKDVDALFAKTDITIGQSLTLLNNEITKFVGESGKGSGAAQVLAGTIQTLASNLDVLTSAMMVGGAYWLGTYIPAIYASGVAVVAKTKELAAQTVTQYAAIQAERAAAAQEVINTQAVVANTQATLAAIAAEKALEVQRLKSQITEKGRTATLTRMAELKKIEAQVTRELALAEEALAVAQSRSAAAGAASVGIGSRLLGLLGGPVGIGITVASLAAGYLLMRDNTAEANKKLEEQARVAEKTDEALKKLAGNDKTKAVDDLTAAFNAQNEALEKSSRSVASALIDIENYARGNWEVEKISQEARKGTISYTEAIERLNKIKLPTDLYENLKKQAAQYDENSSKANLSAEKLKLFTVNVQLAGNQAQNAAVQVKGNTDELNSNANAADKASKAQKGYFDSLRTEVLNSNEELALLNLGYSEETVKKIIELQKAKQAVAPPGTTAIVTKEEMDLVAQAQKALDVLKDKKDALNDAERKQTKELTKQAVLLAGNNEQVRNMLRVYQSFRNAGLGDKQARVLTAQVGRENDFRNEAMFGSHKDANNGYTNTGFISWQKGRSTKLMQSLQGQGVLDKNGKIQQTQDALDAQAKFLLQEVMTNKSYSKSKAALLNDDLDYRSLEKIVGKNFIGWDYEGKKLGKDKASQHLAKQDSYYNQLNKILGASPDAASKAIGDLSKFEDEAYKARAKTLEEVKQLQASYDSDSVARSKKVEEEINKATILGQTDLIPKIKERFDAEEKLAQKQFDFEVNGYKWTEEQKLDYTYETNSLRLVAEGKLTEEQRKIAIDSFKLQQQQELGLLKLAQEQRLFQARQFLYSEVDAIKERYRIEREQIELTTKDEEERRERLSLSKAQERLEILDKAFQSSKNWDQTKADMTGNSQQYQFDQTRLNRSSQSLNLANTQDAALDIQAKDPNANLQEIAAQREQIWAEHTERMKLIESTYQNDSMSLQLGYGANVTGALAGMFKNMLGESSSAYRILYESQRAFALAQAGMNMWKAASDAYANEPGTWYQKAAAAAIATIKSGTFVSLIQAATPQGFADGGYTGNGLKHTPAGIVHKGEVVWSQEDIKRWGGVSVVESMRQSKPSGYANGGYVSNNTTDVIATRREARQFDAINSNQTQSSSSDIPINVYVTVNADGSSKTDTQNDSKQLGQMIGNAVRTIIRQEQRQGGLLSK
ncbi:tail component of prophage CP-933X [Acinetobacter phage MD-2021a]|uniref:tape measure protein n=3 Tax=Acinetobacter baumannii TaxID=470 RepID=UPI000DE698B5|nr:tape measure protein [Acinetobacter baumannii]CAH1091231.1 tail component of prophage CP-933X [Acinetobacter phage MD-2021a]CAH1096527.1 tail component of prophage CP-933X [Acinetobacter phage MD-2021a]SSR77124.1 phage tail length tape-measure protein [Acinetobacter baumannii]SSS33603.1 phage tail length tape-measure protein [Acinetobacter baumannii]SST26332.1 phage tail length tape-measure protein [Acinetobacter baumannii]